MTARLSIRSSTEAPAAAGDWVMAHCLEAGLGDTTAFRVMTCVVEAVNNCVEHAYRDTPGEIGIRLFRNSRWLVVQIQDRGAPVAAANRAGRTRPAADRRPRLVHHATVDGHCAVPAPQPEKRRHVGKVPRITPSHGLPLPGTSHIPASSARYWHADCINNREQIITTP